MKRRALLAALGTGFAGLAGCVGAPGGSNDGTTTNGGRTTSPDSTTATETETRTPNPENVTLTAWPESATLPKATVEFTLTNGANARFAANFYGWHLDKRAYGEWINVSPRAIPEPLHLMEPGASHTWTLTVDDTVPATDDGWTNAYGMEEIEYSGLGPGAYRFRIAGWFERGGGSSAERRHEAAFELTGDPIELRPEPSVTTRREGGTLIAETADYASAARGLRVTATPAPDHDGETERLITELAYRYPGLRNTLPYFEREGVERVRLFMADTSFAVPGHGVSTYVEYEGRVYRIDAEEIEKETETETTDA